MKWTVVVATHNRSELLRRALAAMTPVQGHDMEIIVVDDNSTLDEQAANRQVVAHVPGARYLFIACAHAPGNGVSVARNVGIENASGEVIAFCDDDDHWTPAGYRKLALDAFAEDPRLDMTFADLRTDFQGATVRESWLCALRARLSRQGREGHGLLRITAEDLLAWPGGELPHLDTCLLRRELFERCGAFAPDLRYGEDLDLLLRAVDAAGGIGFVDEIAAIHERPDRERQLSLSSIDERRKLHAGILIMHRIFDACSTPAVRNHARHGLADRYRRLAHWALRDGLPRVAFRWAAVGLAWRWNMRWAGMTLFLALRSALAMARTGKA